MSIQIDDRCRAASSDITQIVPVSRLMAAAENYWDCISCQNFSNDLTEGRLSFLKAAAKSYVPQIKGRRESQPHAGLRVIWR